MSRTSVCACLLLPLALIAAGCGDDNAGTPVTPTPPPAVTEPTISGSIARNGAFTTPFIANTGTITATLATLEPDTAVVGFALGEWNSITELCQIKLANDAATSGRIIVGAAQVTANYCVRIYDAKGDLTGPVSFDVNITHF